MKGWQNYRIITQKVSCSDEMANKIKKFENSPYLIAEGKGFWIHQFPFDQCISLHDLIESIKDKYVMIFKGQAIIIIQKIIEHLYELHKIPLIHENLNAQNIFINFALNSDKLTTFQQVIKVESVYFVNYKWLWLEVEDKEYSFSGDQKAIKKVISQLIEILFDQTEEFTKIVLEFKNRNNTYKFLKQINEYVLNNLDEQKQTLKQNEITNYNTYTKLRYNYEGVVSNQILRIFDKDKQYAYYFEDDNLDATIIDVLRSKTNKIKQYLLQNFYISLMKRFHKYAGNLLETKYVIKEQDFITYFDELDIDKKLGFKFKQIKQNFDEIQQIPQNIITRFQGSYKFQFEQFNKQELFEVYKNFLYAESINFNMTQESHILQMLDLIKQKMQEYLEEYYTLECELKLLKLIMELI